MTSRRARNAKRGLIRLMAGFAFMALVLAAVKTGLFTTATSALGQWFTYAVLAPLISR